MNYFLAILIFGGLAFVPVVLGQKKPFRVERPRTKAAKDDAKSRLAESIALSKRQERVTIRVDVKIQGRDITAHYCFAAPDRYHTSDTENGKILKEAIEISGQRYQRKGDEWVKVRKDPYPIREQIDTWFPIKLNAARDDVFKLRSATVAALPDNDMADSQKYSYVVSYHDFDPKDSGVAWVNSKTNLLQKIQTAGHGLFGLASSVWIYDYQVPVSIEAPKSYVERDWID